MKHFILIWFLTQSPAQAQVVQNIPNPPISGNGSNEQKAQCVSNFRSLNKQRIADLDAMVLKAEEYRQKGFDQLLEAKNAEIRKSRAFIVKGIVNCFK